MNAGILVFLLAAAPLQSAEDVYRKDYLRLLKSELSRIPYNKPSAV